MVVCRCKQIRPHVVSLCSSSEKLKQACLMSSNGHTNGLLHYLLGGGGGRHGHLDSDPEIFAAYVLH